MSKTIKVGTALVKPGEKGTGYTEVAELSGGAKIRVPAVVINGAKPGPTLWITVLLHGDELQGYEACRRVYNETSPADLKGSLVINPVTSVPALISRRHSNPFDSISHELDLEAIFPGTPKGRMSERIAYTLFNAIKAKANYVISFHTMNRYMDAVVWANYLLVPEAKPEVQHVAAEMAKTYGAPFVGERTRTHLMMIAYHCATHGIPVIDIEVDGGGRITNEHVEVAKRGIYNIMKYLKMIEGKPEIAKKQILIHEFEPMYSTRAGLVKVEVKPGQIAPKGSVLARIYNEVFEEVEIITAPEDRLIIGHLTYPVVHTGQRVIYYARRWEEMKSR